MRFVLAIFSAVFLAVPGVGYASGSDGLKLCAGKTPTTTAKAIDACNSLVAKSDGTPNQRSQLYVLRGNLYREAGQIDRAIADYSRAIRLDPSNTTALHNRGSAYRTSKQYRQAIEDLSRALKLAPNFHLARLERGMALLAIKEFRRAIEDFTTGMGPMQMPSILLLRAQAHAGAGMTKKAIADLRAALKLADASILTPPKEIRAEARKALKRLGAAKD